MNLFEKVKEIKKLDCVSWLNIYDVSNENIMDQKILNILNGEIK